MDAWVLGCLGAWVRLGNDAVMAQTSSNSLCAYNNLLAPCAEALLLLPRHSAPPRQAAR